MFKLKQVVAFTALMATAATSYAAVEADKRPINELYQNALREGGIVTVYAGGDTPVSRMASNRRLRNAFGHETQRHCGLQ